MRLLLDSHILLWALDGRLGERALGVILDETNSRYFSLASLWEIAIKLGKGSITAPPDLPARLPELRVELLSITAGHLWSVQHLPQHHKDPFDRIIVAQAMAEDLTLMTHDRKLTQYGCKLLLV